MKHAQLSWMILTPVLAVAACGYPRVNQKFYHGNQWTNVSGPAAIREILLCHDPLAGGVDAMARKLEDSFAPKLVSALGERAAHAEVHRGAASSTACTELGGLNSDSFDVSARLRQAIARELADCADCNTLVLPTIFIGTSRSTSAIRGADGRELGSVENGRTEVSGRLALRLFVFTRAGELAYNGYAEVYGANIELPDSEQQSVIQKLMRQFPEHILRP